MSSSGPYHQSLDTYIAPVSSTTSLCGALFFSAVALLRACVENEAGPPGSWTEEQVIEGERERETLAYVWAKNAQEHGPSTQETQVEPETEQRTRICIYL